MQNSSSKPAGALTAAAAVIASLARLVPHPPNCTPVGALGLFAGGRLPFWLALPLPLALMAATDYLLFAWNGEAPYNRGVYVSLIVYVLLGRLLMGSKSPLRIGAVAVLGSVQFFLITNLGVWFNQHGLATPMYPRTTAGLIECYIAGLPFLGYTLLGDLGCSAVLFGVHALVTQPEPTTEPVAEEARV